MFAGVRATVEDVLRRVGIERMPAEVTLEFFLVETGAHRPYLPLTQTGRAQARTAGATIVDATADTVAVFIPSGVNRRECAFGTAVIIAGELADKGRNVPRVRDDEMQLLLQIMTRGSRTEVDILARSMLRTLSKAAGTGSYQVPATVMVVDGANLGEIIASYSESDTWHVPPFGSVYGVSITYSPATGRIFKSELRTLLTT